MEIYIARRIKEVFCLSEVITENGETVTPIYKIRENAKMFQITENDMKEYLLHYPKEYHEYIDQIVQKIYHPTEENLKKDEILRLSRLR